MMIESCCMVLWWPRRSAASKVGAGSISAPALLPSQIQTANTVQAVLQPVLALSEHAVLSVLC
mgnify:CR=1 FL=1